jgi:hypothetical protein
MEARVKRLPSRNEDIDASVQLPQRLVRRGGPPKQSGRVVRNHDHEIVVAVRSGIATTTGPEEVNPFRVVGVDEPSEDPRGPEGVALVLVLGAEPVGLGHGHHTRYLLDTAQIRDGQGIDD